MTEPTETTTPLKPPGTRALLYAVLSVIAAVPLWLAAYLLYRPGGFTVLGLVVAVASAVVAAVVALVQRLALDRVERVDLRRVAMWAVGVPVAVLLFGLVLGLVLDA